MITITLPEDGNDAGLICIQSEKRYPASILCSMHNDRDFSDVHLLGSFANDGETNPPSPIFAHKSILAFASPYLRTLLSSTEFIDSHQAEVRCSEVRHEILIDIVQIIYTDEWKIPADCEGAERIRGILAGAKFLLMNNLADVCETFLTSQHQLDATNCMETWKFASKYNCVLLSEAAACVIARNLAIVAKDQSFLHLAEPECIKLLQNKLIEAYSSADDMWCAAVAWLSYESPSRFASADVILDLVPLDEVSHYKLGSLAESQSIPMSPKLVSALFEAVKKSQDTVAPSTKVEYPGAWYVIGGEGVTVKSRFMVYEVTYRKWTTLNYLPWKRERAGACAMGSKRLIVMGGNKNGVATADIDEFNLLTSQWATSNCKLHAPRAELAACSDNRKYVYAFGGGNGHEKVIDKYNVSGQKVSTRIAKINVPRFANAVAVLNGGDSFFVAGGYSLAKHKQLASIEKYDRVNNKWSEVAKLTTGRSGLAAALLGDDELFVIGGHNDAVGAVGLVDVLNIRTGQIISKPPLMHNRCGFGAVAVDHNVICVFGGKMDAYSGCSYTNTVEAYDKREGKWTTGNIVPNMPTEAALFGFAAV